MKKNSFIEGALIATFGIVFVKLIGILYVIPFYQLIGDKGGALYGYAYTIYQLFLGVSTAGFPFAISKITSEYNALNNKNAIKQTYDVSLKLIFCISFVVFLFLFIFAPQIGKIIVGSATEGNTYADIAFVVRMISFSILVVPFLSVTKGLLQGHKYITPTANSQIIEQVIRVVVILLGSYLALRVFNLGLTHSVGIAVSGAFAGGLFAYLYLRKKIKQSNLLNIDNQNRENVANKVIIKKIIGYSIPFILISLAYNLYNTVDMILVSRTFTDILHRSSKEIDSILGIYTTWGLKLNMIVLSVSTGLNTSLIPNIVSSYTKNDMTDVNNKFNKALQCILLVIVPISLFLSLLAKPVWTLLYGSNYYGPLIYKYFVFTSLFGSVYMVIVNTLQGLNRYKLVTVSVLCGLITNIILDVPLMLWFNKVGIEPLYGAILATIIGFTITILISLFTLKKKYHFVFSNTIKKIFKYIGSWIIFLLIIELLKLIVPIDLENRLIQIPILALYGIISFGIYGVINYLNGNLNEIISIKKKDLS